MAVDVSGIFLSTNLLTFLVNHLIEKNINVIFSGLEAMFVG